MHTPPIQSPRSTIATRLPSLAAPSAPFCPAGPEPITTRSYSVLAISAHLPRTFFVPSSTDTPTYPASVIGPHRFTRVHRGSGSTPPGFTHPPDFTPDNLNPRPRSTDHSARSPSMPESVAD